MADVDHDEKTALGKKGSEGAAHPWSIGLVRSDFHGSLCDLDEPVELRSGKLACDVVAYLFRCYLVWLSITSVRGRFLRPSEAFF